MPLFGSNYKDAIKSRDTAKIQNHQLDIRVNPEDSLLTAMEHADLDTVKAVADILEKSITNVQQFSNVIVSVVSAGFIRDKKIHEKLLEDTIVKFRFNDINLLSEMFRDLLPRINNRYEEKEKDEDIAQSPMVSIIKNLIDIINHNNAYPNYVRQVIACFQELFDLLGADDFEKYYLESIKILNPNNIEVYTPLTLGKTVGAKNQLVKTFIEIEKHAGNKKIFEDIKYNYKYQPQTLFTYAGMIDSIEKLNHGSFIDLLLVDHVQFQNLKITDNLYEKINEEFLKCRYHPGRNVLGRLIEEDTSDQTMKKLYIVYQFVGKEEFDKLLTMTNKHNTENAEDHLLSLHNLLPKELYAYFERASSESNNNNSNNNEHLKSSPTPHPPPPLYQPPAMDNEKFDQLIGLVQQMSHEITSLRDDVKFLTKKIEKYESDRQNTNKETIKNTTTSNAPPKSEQNNSAFFVSSYPEVPKDNIPSDKQQGTTKDKEPIIEKPKIKKEKIPEPAL